MQKMRLKLKRERLLQPRLRQRERNRQEAAARKEAKRRGRKRAGGMDIDSGLMRMAKAAARSSWKAEFLPKGSWLAWLQRAGGGGGGGGGWGGCAVLPMSRLGIDGRATIAVSLACSPGRQVARLKRFVEELQMLAACDIVPRLLVARVGDLRVDWMQDQAPESARSLQELGSGVGPEAWAQLAYETGRQLAGAADLGVALLQLSADKIHCSFDTATGRFEVRLCALSPDDLRHAREERDFLHLLVKEGDWPLSPALLEVLRCTYVGAAVALLAAGAPAASAATAEEEGGGWRSAIRDVACTVSFVPAGVDAEKLLRCSLFRTLADRFVAVTNFAGGGGGRLAALRALLDYADRDLRMPRLETRGAAPPPRCLGRLYDGFGASAHSSEGARTLASRVSLFGLRAALGTTAKNKNLLLPLAPALQRNDDYVKQDPDDMRRRYEQRRDAWRKDWALRGDAALALRPAKGVTAKVVLMTLPLEACVAGAAYGDGQEYFALQSLIRDADEDPQQALRAVEATRGGSLAVALLRGVEEDARAALALRSQYRRAHLSSAVAAEGSAEGLPSDLCAALRRFEDPKRRPSARREDRLQVICLDRARQCTVVDAEGDKVIRHSYMLKAPGGRHFPLERLHASDLRHPEAPVGAVLSALREGLRVGAAGEVYRTLEELRREIETNNLAGGGDAGAFAGAFAASRSAAAAVEDPVDAQRAALLLHSIRRLVAGAPAQELVELLTEEGVVGLGDGDVGGAVEVARRRAELLYLQRTVGGADVEACWYALELWRLRQLKDRILPPTRRRPF